MSFKFIFFIDVEINVIKLDILNFGACKLMIIYNNIKNKFVNDISKEIYLIRVFVNL